MIAYIKGKLEMKMTEYVVIDVGGIGYKVFMSELGIENIGNIGDTVKVHTYYRVREDDISIFGFNTLEELKMFELLLGVSGVGAKTALTMLAVCEPSEFALAVISEDVKALTGIPGIGPKSAKRIILELKDKIKKEQEVKAIKDTIENKASSKIQIAIQNDEKVKEAISALQVLGYNRKEIEKGLNPKELLHSKIIRDADKIDILYIMTFEEKRTVFNRDDISDEKITNEIYEEFMQMKLLDYEKIQTNVDRVIAHFAYIYDFNFNFSYEYVNNKQYLDKIYKRHTFTDNDTMKRYNLIYDTAKKYIKEKTK